MNGQFDGDRSSPVRCPAGIYCSIDLQVVKGRTARQRRSWAVPPCSSSTELLGWGARATHECASLLRSVVGDRTCVHAISALRRGGACQADAGPEAARIGNTVPRWDGPAPALARGTSSGRSEDRFYAWWRGLCSVKLSIHEPSRGEGSNYRPTAPLKNSPAAAEEALVRETASLKNSPSTLEDALSRESVSIKNSPSPPRGGADRGRYALNGGRSAWMLCLVGWPSTRDSASMTRHVLYLPLSGEGEGAGRGDYFAAGSSVR